MNKETDLSYLSSLNSKFGKSQSMIIELQQENKQLKERIDKSIKYLEEHYSDFPDGMKENYDEETIKILKGE